MPAPMLPLPSGFASIPALAASTPSTAIAPTNAQKAAYQIPDPTNRPQQDIQLTRIFMPLAVGAVSAQGQTPPANVFVQLLLTLANQILWGWSDQLSMVPVSGYAQSTANAVVTDDMVNPVLIEQEDSPTLFTIVTFDQATTNSGVGVSAIATNPSQNTGFGPLLGSLYYTTPTS